MKYTLTYVITPFFVICGVFCGLYFINNDHSVFSKQFFHEWSCAIANTFLYSQKEPTQITTNPYLTNSESTMPSIVHDPTTPFQKATFGMGCFWANDALFGAQPGVLRTRVGYSGGTTPNPVYKKMELIDKNASCSTNTTGPGPSNSNTYRVVEGDWRGDHTEVVEIDFDPQIISYEDLLELFWNNHEYGFTTFIKRQYMSLILYHDEKQRRIAEKSIEIEAGKKNDKIYTELAKAGIFYPAEDYHQKYRLQKHPWILEELQITPELLQRSQIAAKLNGYITGVGTSEDFDRDMKRLGIPEKIASFVKSHFQENEGGSLYC